MYSGVTCSAYNGDDSKVNCENGRGKSVVEFLEFSNKRAIKIKTKRVKFELRSKPHAPVMCGAFVEATVYRKSARKVCGKCAYSRPSKAQ